MSVNGKFEIPIDGRQSWEALWGILMENRVRDVTRK